ncbi:hypothetical protein BGZ63DRAFT_373728 [Mariannaea sp. PMI_226]|nr:hypothetical protein BGZ63DRAFT_373728 [Mariannaea sp. PMI_226]
MPTASSGAATSDESYHHVISDLDIFTTYYDSSSATIGDFPPFIELVKVRGLPVSEFRKWNEQPLRPFRLFFYSAETETMIVKLPTRSHERLHLRLFQHITSAADALGMTDVAVPDGSTTYFMKKAGYLTAAGEGDSSLGLHPDSLNDGFPTVVIEAGWSQTLPAIRAKMHWWFDVSNGAVKIVLLAMANRAEYGIILEKWKRGHENPPSRPGATRTRSFSANLQVPTCHQTVTITRVGGANVPWSYQVVRAPLRLEFRDVFLREPVPPQTDILFNEERLKNYASIVWGAGDSIPEE